MLAANVLGLCEEGELETQMFNKPQMLVEAQMFNLALLPLFRKTLVGRSALLSKVFINVIINIAM